MLMFNFGGKFYIAFLFTILKKPKLHLVLTNTLKAWIMSKSGLGFGHQLQGLLLRMLCFSASDDCTGTRRTKRGTAASTVEQEWSMWICQTHCFLLKAFLFLATIWTWFNSWRGSFLLKVFLFLATIWIWFSSLKGSFCSCPILIY